MNKREIIATILKYADELDSLGLPDEADALTGLADKFGSDYHFPEEDDRAFLRDDMLAQEPDELERMKLLDSLGDESDGDLELDDSDAPPDGEDELFDPGAYTNSVADQGEEDTFRQMLSDSGADVA